jgi:pimeloyl-ACP methyl ester carboxylesterase
MASIEQPEPGSTESFFVRVGGHEVECRRLPGRATVSGGPSPHTLVFLHEGLGSIGQWREFPASIVAACGLPAIVYARYGYGFSDVLETPQQVDFMHREAREALPELLRLAGIASPILIGHSDGASIALIYAGSGLPAAGVAVMAPHVFVEDESIAGIVAAKRAFESGELAARLARYHRDPEKTFRGWNDVWLSPAFRNWNIESFLPAIKCPLLAIQGAGDEYGTMAQLDAIARQAGGPVSTLKLENCGHAPHKDQPEKVTRALVEFIGRCAS